MIDMPLTMSIPFLIIIGASFGSFLNVVIYRVPKKMSLITPRSHCFNCKSPIKAINNIPVIAYFLLRGKCNNCGKSS